MPLTYAKLIPKTKKIREAQTSTFYIKINYVEATSIGWRATMITTNVIHFPVPNERPNNRFKFVMNPRRGSDHFGDMPQATSTQNINN